MLIFMFLVEFPRPPAHLFGSKLILIDMDNPPFYCLGPQLSHNGCYFNPHPAEYNAVFVSPHLCLFFRYVYPVYMICRTMYSKYGSEFSQRLPSSYTVRIGWGIRVFPLFCLYSRIVYIWPLFEILLNFGTPQFSSI